MTENIAVSTLSCGLVVLVGILSPMTSKEAIFYSILLWKNSGTLILSAVFVKLMLNFLSVQQTHTHGSVNT